MPKKSTWESTKEVLLVLVIVILFRMGMLSAGMVFGDVPGLDHIAKPLLERLELFFKILRGY